MKRLLRFFLATLAAVSSLASRALPATNRQPSMPGTPLPGGFALEWESATDLPDPPGLKGMYAGVSGQHVVLAGGSNFPVPQRAGGMKVFHRAIYVRPVDAPLSDPWTKADAELSVGVGEGASVTTEDGIVGLGGHDGVGPVASVILLKYDSSTRDIIRLKLPDLPVAVANASAALTADWIYVAGGEGRQGAQGTFWRLNLTAARASAARERWQSLRGWPGPPCAVGSGCAARFPQ